MALSLVSVNIEGPKHLEKVSAFLQKQKPDVVCLQELLEPDIPRFEDMLGIPCSYAPMLQVPENDRLSNGGKSAMMGIGFFSRTPVRGVRTHYYHRGPHETEIFNDWSVETKRSTQSCVFLVGDIEHEEAQFRIGTTHFTWTPDGQADDYQREDIDKLLEILTKESPLVFCGDFNAPRGGEIFSRLASTYKDNIPASYATSLDISIHRNGKIDAERLSRYMVEGLFSTPEYQVKNAKLSFGVSDHAAITADIERVG